MYVCHPSYVGSVNRRIGVQAGLRHSSKNTWGKKGWGRSSGRVTSWQVQGPKFNSQYCQKKKKRDFYSFTYFIGKGMQLIVQGWMKRSSFAHITLFIICASAHTPTSVQGIMQGPWAC
jgi:hypothetical protein